MDPVATTEQRLTAIREVLPATGAGIRLDATIAGPFPAETDRAMRELDAWRLRVGRSDPGRLDDLAQRGAEARSVVAAVLGADPDRIVLASGIRAILGALATRADRGAVLCVVGAAPSALEAACAAVARGHDLGLRVVEPGDPLPPATRLVVVPLLDARTGDPVDLSPIAQQARGIDALVVVDASWTAGATELRVDALDADAVVIETDHWLLGPDGVTAGWLGDRLDVGTIDGLLDPPPLTSMLGVARSVGWLLMYVGLPWALERTRDTARSLRDALAVLPGVSILGDAASTSHVLGLRLDAWSAVDAAEELGRRCFAVVDVDEPRDLLRVSTGPWSRDDELERFAREVAELARHTPASLPRRPALTVLGQ
ncbi:MAG: aminotransferase class V-fold PLP-dependent enzyme [Chloroflexi bacterium]|nr:aminotransferase class V-fold PLP-dependent enzyme [Chloroflexota bacterium]